MMWALSYAPPHQPFRPRFQIGLMLTMTSTSSYPPPFQPIRVQLWIALIFVLSYPPQCHPIIAQLWIALSYPPSCQPIRALITSLLFIPSPYPIHSLTPYLFYPNTISPSCHTSPSTHCSLESTHEIDLSTPFCPDNLNDVIHISLVTSIHSKEFSYSIENEDNLHVSLSYFITQPLTT